MSDIQWLGKYKVVRLLGEGATSKVYLVVHEKLDQYRAVKCILRTNPYYEQARQEAYLLTRLKNPNIPVVYDVEEDKEALYIVEEYIEGETLLSYRERSHFLSESTILIYSIQICEIIEYLHSMKIPILYLDFKPSNFMITGTTIKLIDLGGARESMTCESMKNFGTPGFAAPEQYQKVGLGVEADIYGIGMLLYFMMTGYLKIKEGDLPCIMDQKEYSKEFLQIIAKAIRHNPCERYGSVMRLKKELLRILKKGKRGSNLAKTSKKIAIAGAEPKIGATHFAFYLLSYLQKKGHHCLYVECGSTNVVKRIINAQKAQHAHSVLFCGCELTRQEWLSGMEQTKYDYIIYDYGCITREKEEVLLQADYSFIICGGRVWEWPETIKVLEHFCDVSKVRYIINHLTAREFYERMKEIKSVMVYRMPMQCDPFAKPSDLVCGLVREILG